MKFRHVIVSAALALAAGALGGCSTPDEEVETADLTAADGVSAKVPGMTVWISREAKPDWRYDQRVWVLEGRTSKNIESAFSFASDDEFGEAIVTSARKFEVVLDNMMIVHLMQGYPLYVEIHTTTGAQKQYFAELHLGPRFGLYSGSSKIYVVDTVTPVVVGGDALFRGRATLGSGTSALTVTAGDAAPETLVKAGSKWSYDWSWPNLVLAAEGTDPVAFGATGSSGPLAKTAHLSLALTKLVLQTAIPDQPELACADSVRDCLEALPAGSEDASSCGEAAAVKQCQWQVTSAPGPQRFANDLTLYLAGWYGEHAADVTAGDGQPIGLGLASVHAAAAEEITAPADDPHGHDLTKYKVFVHPDVVWPGSDQRWFGAYDKQTGQLQSVYGFN